MIDTESDPEQARGLDHDESESESPGDGSEGSSSGEELAKKETRMVNIFRALVISVLIVTAVGASVLIYRYTSDQEQDDFHQAFHSHAIKVLESVQVNTAAQLTAVDNCALSMTTYALDTNSTWPFVTIPSFSLLARNTLSQANALILLTHTIITEENRAEWNKYIASNHGWKAQDLLLQDNGFYNKKLATQLAANASATKESGAERSLQQEFDVVDVSKGYGDDIYMSTFDGPEFRAPKDDFLFPLWQNAPTSPGIVENYDGKYVRGQQIPFEECRTKGFASTGPSFNTQGGRGENLTIADSLLAKWGREDETIGTDPLGRFFYPVFADLDRTSEVVSVIVMYTHWRKLFMDTLPPDAVGIYVVMESTCDQRFTYVINGKDVIYLDQYDLHDPTYDDMVYSTRLTEHFNENQSPLYYGVPLSTEAGCLYTIRIYPSKELEDTFVTNAPLTYTIAALAIFVFSIVIFIAYDTFVGVRQRLVMGNALRTGAIVSSMFPKAIQERMMEEEKRQKKLQRRNSSYMSHAKRINSFLNDDAEDDIISAKPIADLFPETTVLFADIANFTSWSSARDPAQVFALLQSIFQSFDKIAQKKKVFKVETVGDSYVAVAGLPMPQPNHAVIMAQFAQACLFKFNEITRRLEITLGPDTADLQMRFGLHSGPCTAGVLRGERSRFQLFGDTVNMAARMENSSLPNRIQISKSTAEYLKDAGKKNWFVPRKEEVKLKGKGLVDTFFITEVEVAGSICSQVPSHSEASTIRNISVQGKRKKNKTDRLIAWNVEILASRLRQIMSRRMVVKGKNLSSKPQLVFKSEDRAEKTCLDEMEDVMSMPAFDPKIASKEVDPDTIDLGNAVMSQLRTYVEMVANMYRDNPFHNFEHASHVAMSVDKLLKRIVAPDINIEAKSKKQNERKEVMMGLHNYTHGITSDPIIQFGIVFSALIHDTDHKGVSNMQLAKEEPSLATVYRNKSIAEQNSIDLAWDALMAPELTDLRNCIYTDKEELTRFRQTVINVVLATDIFDKELNDLRKQRWNKAFAEQVLPPDLVQQDVNVKATIVIEHLIQASDVSHTMQHWHIYRKWNERLFCEMHMAFKQGRMGADPATFWYQGEIKFFDNYIIPLAKKLKDCNVFGVSSDEYLSYAKANREEWEQKGEQIVAELVERNAYKNAIQEEEEDDDEVEEGDREAWESGEEI